MRRMALWLIQLLLLVVIAIPALAEPARQASVDEGRLQQLQSRMMSDSQIMSLIAELEHDPDLRSLINDPSFLQAIGSRDVNTILNDPRIVRLLNNPTINEIIRRVGP